MDSWLIFQHYRNSIKTDGGTRTVSLPCNGFSGEVKGDPDWQIRRVVLPGKASKESQVSVPQTDTGGRDEYSKALG